MAPLIMKALPVSIALLLAAASASAAAQGPEAGRMAVAAGSLRPGSTVRIATSDAQLTGRLVRVDSSVLLLRTTGSEQPIPLRVIDSLLVRRRATARGAAIGGAVGAVSLALLWHGFVTGTCDAADGCRGDFPAAVGGGLALGAAGGALVGGVVGSSFRRWRRLHP